MISEQVVLDAGELSKDGLKGDAAEVGDARGSGGGGVNQTLTQ